MNAEEKAILRFNDYLYTYGAKALNLVIERSKTAELKRSMFRARFNDDDAEREAEYTNLMDELTKDIAELDNRLLMLYGIVDKQRTQILRDLKKVRGDQWDEEFAEE